MKLQKEILIVATVLTLVTVACLSMIATDSFGSSVSTEDSNTIILDGIKYSLTDRGDEEKNTAEIIEITSGVSSELIIPKYVTDDNGIKYHLIAINGKFPPNNNAVKNVTFEDNPGLLLSDNLFLNTRLVSVKIGEGIELSSGIFSGCSKLVSVELPSTLTAVPDSAFQGCISLTNISLGEKVTSIGKSAFSGCSGLSEIGVSESLQKIGSEAFKNCTKLTKFDLGPNVYSIGGSAFSGTKVIINISANLTEIEVGETSLFDDLEAISIPEENPAFTVENGVVYNKDKTTLLYFPRNVTTEDGTFTTSANIGPYAFYNTKLSKITITEGAKTISDHAFSKSPVLSEVILPQSVESIGEAAFYECSSLTDVTLPKTMNSLGASAFYQTSIAEITIPSGITSIQNNTFFSCGSLKTVNVLDDLTEIGDFAFYLCTELTTFPFSDSITSIGKRAFFFDNNLMLTKLPSKLESVGSSAFENCSNVKITELPDTLKMIGARSFYKTSIESIRVGENTSVEFVVDVEPEGGKYYAFGGDALKSIYLNNVSISTELYYGTLVEITDTLENYELGPDFKLWKWVNGIGLNEEKKTAYLVDSDVSIFTIPLTVEKLLGTGFQGSNITEITYEGGSDRTITMETGMQRQGIESSTSSGMFANCMSLVKVTLPTIVLVNNEKSTFGNCTSLKEVDISTIDTLPSSFSCTLEKFILRNCKVIEAYPIAYYMELPENLVGTCASNFIKDSDGNSILNFKGTSQNANIIQKIAGKTLVWNGCMYLECPIVVPLTSGQVVVCLDYGANKAYVGVDKGSLLDLSSYSYPMYETSAWYTDPEKNTEYDSNTTISEATTLYADSSVKSCKVTVNLDGGDTYEIYSDGKKIASGDSVPYGSETRIVVPTKDGYNVSIKTSPNLNTKTQSNGVYDYRGITADTTFTITYSPTTAILKFDTVGAGTILPIMGTSGADYTAPSNPEKEGYEFIGWSPKLPDKLPSTWMTTYTALWAPKTVSISLDTKGGDPLDGVSRSYNTMYGSMPVPVRDGYKFVGWYGADGTEVKYTDIVNTAEGVTLYADWVEQFTITFDSNGGSDVAAISQGYNSDIIAPAAPTKTGYTFQYWEKDGEKYDLTTMPAENITLKAVWKANEYTITFDSKGGSTVDAITQDYNTPVSTPAAPTKTGYTFQYWSKDGAKYDLTTMPAENITLKAVWLINAKCDNGTASIELGTEGGSFVVPVGRVETVTVSMGSNTSVKVESGSYLAGKVVVSEVKAITNPAPATISGTAYEFVLTADGAQYGGKMLVTLPYTGVNGKEAVVYYWNGSEAEKMKVVEYTENSVTFETSHNSTYVVASEKIVENVNGLLIIAVVAIVLAAIISGSVYYFKVVRPRKV